MHDRLTKTGKPIRGKGLKTMPKIDDAEWVADDFAGTGYSMNQIIMGWVSGSLFPQGLNQFAKWKHFEKSQGQIQ